ncbi:MAG: AMP-binding protein [Thalassovita sp.]
MQHQDILVPDVLALALQTHSDACALSDQDHRLSYQDLAAFVALCRKDLVAQKAVAIYGRPSALFGAAAVTCVIDGRPFVHLDPAMPDTVLANIVAELGISVVIKAQEPKAGQLPDHCIVQDAQRYLNGAVPDVVKAAKVDPSDPIYLVATSGTTGRPKCIPVTQDSAALSYQWRDAYTPYSPGMRVGAYIFAIWEVFRPLRNGAEVCFPSVEDLMSPHALAGFIKSNDIKEMLFTPSFFEKWLQGVEDEQCADSPLQRVVLNGEVVSEQLVKDAWSKLPNAELWNLYSICETHDICMSKITTLPRHQAGVSVGKAMPFLRAVVLDDHDQPCAVGVPGLLHFEGPRMLGPGYVNRPEETKARFRSLNVEGRDVRLYDTGDQGYVDADGQIFVMGRIAHMLKLRGHSIQTRELIETLSGLIGFSHAIPWVQQTQDQHQALVVYYTADADQTSQNLERWALRADGNRTPEALTKALRQVLPHYCVPTYLVKLDEIPLNQVSGKCDFKALPPLKQDAAPTSDQAKADFPVLAACAQVMHCHPDDIDQALSFHDQGGDSLMCVDLIAILERVYGRQVDFDWALNLPLQRLHTLLSAPLSEAGTAGQFRSPGILLTGVTGFLGAHVLAAALERLPQDRVVYCLVRPRNNDPQVRLDAVIKRVGADRNRVKLVAGAIDDPRFGLEAESYQDLTASVERVVHCAAMVNLAVDHNHMEAWSQSGIKTVLRFCQEAQAELRFTSSTSVFPDIGGPHPEKLATRFAGCSGYGAAKIAAERLITEANVNATIVRLPSLYDLAAPNPKDLYETLLQTCATTQTVPQGFCFPMTDVRAAAQFLVAMPDQQGVAFFNLISDSLVRVDAGETEYRGVTQASWAAQSTLSEGEQRLLQDNPHVLSASATFENSGARHQWQQAQLGAFALISDQRALLERRLGQGAPRARRLSDA